MELSVLSVLARLGKDPWVEAARLAGLPEAVAVDSLANALAGVPAAHQPQADAKAVALSLVPLLPAHTHPASGATSAKAHQADRMMAVLLVGNLLGTALACGLLIGAAFCLAFHADKSTTVAAPLRSGVRSEGQPHRERLGQSAVGSDMGAPVLRSREGA